MASKKKKVKKATNALSRLQGEHKELGKKLGATRRKLDERSGQLRIMEAKIAKMERQAHRPVGTAGRPTALKAEALRPARLIFNPAAGMRGKEADSLETLVATLRAHGIITEVSLKTSGKTARDWAHEAVEKHEALVIVAGTRLSQRP